MQRSWFLSKASRAVSQEFRVFFKKEFGLRVRNGHWYREALTHASLQNSLGDTEQANERLEFLGDSILGAVASDLVFFLYPQDDEGVLTQRKSRLVSRKTLNKIGIELGLTPFIHSKFETESIPQTVIGNALEALIGAMYMDHGYRKTKRALRDALMRHGARQILESSEDFKSRLHHWSQVETKELEYEVVEITGVDGNKLFEAVLLVDGHRAAKGSGSSKKKAEQEAARIALEQGEWRHQNE